MKKMMTAVLHSMKGWLMAALLLATLPALAQGGGIAGEVRDPHDALVANAAVKVASQTTNKVSTVRTDAQGRYAVADLAAGSYSIEVQLHGFKKAQLRDVKVEANAIATANIKLTVANTSQSVEVNASALSVDVKANSPALLGLVESVKENEIEFTATDIEALHPATLVDLLQNVPGFEADFQGRQHADFLTMRGGGVQIILDGVYLSQTDRLLATLPTQSIESVKVVRDATALSIGPLAAYHSFTNGSSGVGTQGFVIIKTKRAQRLDGGFVSSGGSFETAMGHAYLGSKSGRWDYRGAWTYYNTEGKDHWNMESKNASAMFHGGYSGRKLNMDFLYYGSRGFRNLQFGTITLPTYVSKTKTYDYSKVGTLSSVANFNITKLNSNLFALNVAQRWNENNRTVLQYAFDGLDVTSVGAAQNNTQADFDLKHTLMLRGHVITGGGQLLRYIAPSGSATPAGLTGRADDAMASWYVQDEFRLLQSRLTIDGGLRGDKLHYATNPMTMKKADMWQSENYTIAVGASYKLTPKWTLATRYGFVQSAPPGNVVSTTGAALPNQAQQRGEINAKVRLNPHLAANTSLYVYSTKNGLTYNSTVTTSSTGEDVYHATAATGVMTYGGDFGFTGRVIGPLSYSASYTYLETDIKSNNMGMSHHFANARLNYQQKHWFGNFSMVYVGPKWYTTGLAILPYYEMANYTRFDANAGANFKVFSRRFSAKMYSRNLSNNSYASMYKTGAYLDPGRTVGIELAGKFFGE